MDVVVVLLTGGVDSLFTRGLVGFRAESGCHLLSTSARVDGDAQQIEVDGVGGLGRDQARVDQRTLAHDQTLVVELLVTFLEQRPRQIMPRQLLAEPADRRVIRRRLVKR